MNRQLMDIFACHCQTLGVPAWVAPLLHSASRLRSDRSRRKKAYRLLQRTLFFHGVGLNPGVTVQPTYVYPAEVKQLVRTAFPEDVCDYPDPSHGQVVYVTMEDLQRVQYT